MIELGPEAEAAQLAELDKLIAADEAELATKAGRSADTSKSESRELEPKDLEADSGKQTAPDNSQPKQQQQQPDPKAQEQEKDAATIEQEEKNLSPYERAKRKNARDWQRVQKKEAQLSEREAKILEWERKQAASQAPAPQKPAPTDQQSIDRSQLEKAMEIWKEQGRSDLLELGRKELEAMDKAAAMQPRQPAQGVPAPTRDPAVDREMALSWDKAKTDYPDIMSPGSPLNSEFRKFHQDHPDIFEHPKAPLLVAQFVDYKLRAARLPELSATIERLQNELQALKTSTSLIPGGSAANGAVRNFADLSTEEQAAELEREYAGRG